MKKLVCFLIGLCAFTNVYAQINQYEFIRYQYLRPGIHFKSWSFDQEAGLDNYIQVTAPVVYSMALGSRVGVDVIASPFISAIKKLDGDYIHLIHLSDAFVRGSVLLGNNLALLTVGVGIPTGKSHLDAKEITLAGLAASRPLDNPVSSFGSGTSVSLGLAVAHKINSWVVGLGVGYSMRNKYEATAIPNDKLAEFDYDPGDELNITLGIEREFELSNGKAKVMADFIYSNYFTDEVNGAGFFEAGDKILLRGRLTFPLAFIEPMILSVTQRWRLDNATTLAALIENSNELDLRATFYIPLGKTFSFKSVVQTQFFTNTANGADGATIFGIGGGFVLNLSRHFTFDPTFVYHKGTINTILDPSKSVVTEINVTGIEASGGFAFRF